MYIARYFESQPNQIFPFGESEELSTEDQFAGIHFLILAFLFALTLVSTKAKILGLMNMTYNVLLLFLLNPLTFHTIKTLKI